MMHIVSAEIGGEITTLLTTYGLPTTLALVFAYTLIRFFNRTMDENKERELRVVENMKVASDSWMGALEKNTISYNNLSIVIQALKDEIEHSVSRSPS